jgi:hypothetical protein
MSARLTRTHSPLLMLRHRRRRSKGIYGGRVLALANAVKSGNFAAIEVRSVAAEL